MKVYLNSEGAILQTVPSVIPRGSTVTDFEVEAPFSAAIMAVRFTLRTGTTEPMILPMVSSVSAPGLNLWSAKLDAAVTEFSGSVPYSIEVRDASGYLIRTVKGSLTISPGQTPTVPADPPKDAWTAIRNYLNQILSYAKEAAIDSNEAKEWIEDFEAARGITVSESGKSVLYKLVESGTLSELVAMLEAYQNGEIKTDTSEIEQDVSDLQRWVEIFESAKGLPVTEENGAIRIYKLIKSGDLNALLEMLGAYQRGEIGSGDATSPTAKVEQTTDGAKITITDKNGTTVANVANGKDGTDGKDGADGADGAPGKSAYNYAQDGGYTGTEAEFSNKLAQEIPKSLPNPHPITINGKTYDGSEEVNITITGGASSDNVLLGQTPITMTENAAVRLVGSGEYSYAVKGKTVADISTVERSDTMVTVAEKEGYFEIAVSGATNWIDAHADITVSGLKPNTPYVLCVKATNPSLANKIGGSYFIIRQSSGTQIVTQLCDSAKLFSIPFTPDSSSVKIVWYPANNYYWNNDCKTSRIEDLYVNKSSDGTERTKVIDETGTFTDSYSLGVVSKGVTISTVPSCEVYAVSGGGESGGASAPLAGKTVVCFGDSLFGMYTGDTSTPAYVAQRTGAIVHNVGFGGCRMSAHPYSEYNAFSMYSLADAIASGDWTAQDAAAPQGSANFPDQLAILKSIDFGSVDSIVIHYGTNDFAAGTPVAIDNASNPKATNTLCGALRYSIEKLLGAYPNLHIFVSVPAFRSDVSINNNGYKLTDFVEAIANTAREYNLPIIDSYYGLGINSDNASTFLSDGVHHNIEGRKRFGEYIGAKLIAGGDTWIGASTESGGNGIPYIVGDSTTAGVWTGTYEGITEYYEGLTVLYKLNVAGVSGGSTLNINGLGAVSVKRNASTTVTTTYPVGSVVMLTYSGGAWLTADYDVDGRNTAGTGALSNTKLFVVGSRSQNANGVKTNTNSGVYIGTDNELYSNGKKVAHADEIPEVPDVSGFVKSVNGNKPDANGNVSISTGGSGGGTSIDVTAEVGQTIIVKEVDASGKPTKWEAAEYQPRTHWSEFGTRVLVPHTVFIPLFYEALSATGCIIPDFGMEIGKSYTVIFDGVEYSLTAKAAVYQGMDAIYIGNDYLANGTLTSEPFIVASVPGMGAICICLTEETIHTIKIVDEAIIYHKIPQEYAPNEYRCVVQPTPISESPMFFADWNELRSAIRSNKNVYADIAYPTVEGGFRKCTYILTYANIDNINDGDDVLDFLNFVSGAANGNLTYNGKDMTVTRKTDGTVSVVFVG